MSKHDLPPAGNIFLTRRSPHLNISISIVHSLKVALNAHLGRVRDQQLQGEFFSSVVVHGPRGPGVKHFPALCVQRPVQVLCEYSHARVPESVQFVYPLVADREQVASLVATGKHLVPQAGGVQGLVQVTHEVNQEAKGHRGLQRRCFHRLGSESALDALDRVNYVYVRACRVHHALGVEGAIDEVRLVELVEVEGLDVVWPAGCLCEGVGLVVAQFTI